MKVLQHDELMDYLNKAIEVETDVAIQERIIAEYEKKVEEIKPVLELNDLPTAPNHTEVVDWQVTGFGIVLIVSALFLFLVLAPHSVSVGLWIGIPLLLFGAWILRTAYIEKKVLKSIIRTHTLNITLKKKN